LLPSIGADGLFAGPTKLTSKPALSQAGSPAKILQGVSLASTNVINPKIGVFQHNPSTPAVHCAQKVVILARSYFRGNKLLVLATISQ
jgi:hypothetical protein